MYSFLVDEDAPRHLKRQLGEKSMFEFVYFCDEAEGMDGLVDYESEDSASRAEEVQKWFEAKLDDEENKFKLPFVGPIDICVTIACHS